MNTCDCAVLAHLMVSTSTDAMVYSLTSDVSKSVTAYLQTCIRGPQSYLQRTGLTEGFHSNQAGVPPDSIYLIS